MTATLSRETRTVTNARGSDRHERSDTPSKLGDADLPDPLDKPRPVVAITGAARGIGQALTRALAESSQVKKVVAIDDHRGDSNGVTWRVADVRDPALAGRLAGVDVVVHADIDLTPDADARKRRAFNVRGAQTVLTSAAAARISRMVLVTSAMVYGAGPDNPVPLPERAPLAAQVDSSVAGDMLEIEQLARRSPRTNPGMGVTVVRPAALAGEGIDTLVTRHFEAPRLLTVKGCVPRWQFCHVDDLVSALEFTVVNGIEGELAVGSEGWLEQEEVERISGLKSIELPARLTFGTAQRLHQMGVTPAPAIDLRYVAYPLVVDGATLRDAGWRPAYSNADALSVLLGQRRGRHAVAGRRIARKEATITVAGATVAAIGTAAIVRRARRRQKS
ncbi:MAG: NAD-dependent epimerase/dehydratase family protein [Streptosporangiaceae bacterium]|nr:NAD-dependent epimerase/dehydratase family protein [Streptosporangiaceae bacterium]